MWPTLLQRQTVAVSRLGVATTAKNLEIIKFYYFYIGYIIVYR